MADVSKDKLKIRKDTNVDSDNDQLGENEYEAFSGTVDDNRKPIGNKNKKERKRIKNFPRRYAIELNF
jgi:hypothetical protein